MRLPTNLPQLLLEMERRYYAAALEVTHGNAAAAARLLGLTGHAARVALVRLGIRQRRRIPQNARWGNTSRRRRRPGAGP